MRFHSPKLSEILPAPIAPALQLWLEGRTGNIKAIRPLQGGHHQNWWLDTDAGEFVLRQPASCRSNGLDYQREGLILQAINTFTWALQGELYESASPWLLSRFVPGESAHSKSFHSDELWQQLLGILAELPTLTRELLRQSQPREMESYLEEALNAARQTAAARSFVDDAQQWLKAVYLTGGWSLNHHDLTPHNFRVTPEGQLVLLDWEYAAVSLSGWDCAALPCYFELKPNQLEELRQLTRLRHEQFATWTHTAKLLDYLWYWQQPPPTRPGNLAQLSQTWRQQAENFKPSLNVADKP